MPASHRLALCLALLPLLACDGRGAAGPAPAAPAAGALTAQATATPEVGEAELVRQVGGLLLVGFDGTTAADPGVVALRQQAEAGHVAGVIFMGYNVVDPPQVRALVAHMRAWRTPLPLLVAVDQEGGAVARLAPAKGFVATPSAADVARAGDPAAYDGMAQMLGALGFNLNFGPVVDLALNPDGPAIGARGRAYGADPETVVAWASTFVRAHRRAGVCTVLKHFPGHGSAAGDTHRGLTDVTDAWQGRELDPFARLIDAHLADAVMSAHLSHAGLDPAWPLSLSPTFMPQALRERLGYDGAVISDALDMGALWAEHPLEAITVAALAASNDLLIFSMNGAAHGNPAAHEPIDQLPARAAAAVGEGLADGRLRWPQLQAARRRAAALAVACGDRRSR